MNFNGFDRRAGGAFAKRSIDLFSLGSRRLDAAAGLLRRGSAVRA